MNEERNINENDEIAESSKVQEKQNNPSENLREMEEQISEDIVRLEVSLANEISEIEKNESTGCIKKKQSAPRENQRTSAVGNRKLHPRIGNDFFFKIT